MPLMRHTRAIEKTAKMHLEAKKCIRVKAYWTLKPASPPRICHDALSQVHAAAPKEGKNREPVSALDQCVEPCVAQAISGSVEPVGA